MSPLLTTAPQREAEPEPHIARLRPGRLHPGIRHALAFYLLSRLLTLCVALYASAQHAGFTISKFLSTWDGGFYLETARHGYPAGVPEVAGRATQSTIAYFPLYPLSIRVVSTILPVSDAVAGIIVSMLFGAICVVLVYALVQMLWGHATAERAAILFSLFPASFLLSMTYSEALMLALAAACLLALVRGRWLGAGVAAALATACRPNAFALVLACGWASGQAIWRRRDWTSLIAPALAPTGLVAFFAFLWWRTGDATAWFRVQHDGWQQEPLTALFKSPLHGLDALVVLGFVFAVTGLVLLVRQGWPGALTIYTGAILMMNAAHRLDSLRPRTLFTAFPLILAVAKGVEGRWFTWLAAGSTVALCVLTYSYNTFQLGQI